MITRTPLTSHVTGSTLGKCAIALLLTSVTLPAVAGLADTVNSLAPGSKYRVLFVTDSVTDATSTDIETYNTAVQTAAAAGSETSALGLSWKAFASTETVNAQTNASVSNADLNTVYYLNTNGDFLAFSAAGLLDGLITHPVQFNADGVDPGVYLVWTGTNYDGQTFPGESLGSPGPNGRIGRSTGTTADWVATGRQALTSNFHLYGLSSTAVAGVVIPTLSCSGFESPMDKGPVSVKKNRVLPFKAQLTDENGQVIDGLGVSAPPVIEVSFDDNVNPAVDVTDDALASGAGTDGNQFEFLDTQWQFNLKMTNYSAQGTYTVTMKSGDEGEYSISPSCSGQFVIG